ncbi:single-stranded DNA-binding protein [Streptomyces sp. NPDC102360]|uniref:single-stranded DNA-binding protein n=1 Tax=Streptomyces sp. NPDC102360 TaxID=3366160 RepID=UPI003801D799
MIAAREGLGPRTDVLAEWGRAGVREGFRMGSETMVTVVGNVATTPVFRELPTGPVARFRLAAHTRRFDRVQNVWVDGHTNFFTVWAWRALGTNVQSSLALGEPVMVQGKLKVRDEERGGQHWTSADIEAVAIGHDLSRGTSAFRRVQQLRAEGAARGDSARADSPRADAPWSDSPRGDSSRGDSPRTDAPWGESPRGDSPWDVTKPGAAKPDGVRADRVGAWPEVGGPGKAAERQPAETEPDLAEPGPGPEPEPEPAEPDSVVPDVAEPQPVG